ncbi:restriction endonuclease subunit S [Enterococcus faecium]|nr:restriction endonuclease subunit S [Enterococcus faecium]MDT6463734.1 restriction endonuclease subunit S [Enterococcus faecium]MDT6488150.1 restriction endonuclease subunit S [Enterococcus faecium]MDV4658816.1 restriction endonuclease subunit S [Enterococcus faecium]RCF78242.1 restriction endonuclease subunit S [Enterococcus faecium]HAR0965348.1 restriction endonuclease subunit S [Enterococcus faecium]
MSNDIQPEIRFPGFTEAWEQRKFECLLDKKDGVRRGPFGSALKKEFFVSNSNFVVYEQQNAIYDNYETRYKITEKKYNELIKFKLEPGDFIMSGAGTIGRISRVPKQIKPGVFNQALIRLRINKEITDSEYFIQFIRADFMQRKLTGANPGSAITNLVPMSEVKKWIVQFPILEEQKKIGNFFKQLDDTIALQQRKLDLLKETKKGFLQKMFPKNGAKVPEVRFPGFTGDWEERKLGEVVVFLNGRAFKQQELLDSGKYRVLRVGNFNTNDRWYYSNLELEEDKYANKGDLLYLWATSFGPEMWNEERVIYHYHIWKLKFLSKELDKQYLYTWLLTDKEKIKESTNGTTMVHVTKGGIEQRTFQFPPDINEQQKIGAFFKQLDDTIALHQRKLDLLKETKKGFLQKMFV